MKTLFSVLVFALAGLGWGQDPPDGKTGKWVYSMALSARVEFAYRFTQAGERTILVDECVNPCKGEKHTSHRSCDQSCDYQCPHGWSDAPGAHSKTMRPILGELGAQGDDPPGQSHSDTLEDAFDAFNLPSVLQADWLLDCLKAECERVSGRAETVFTPGHWNKTPCSSSPRLARADRYILTVEYTLFDKPGSGQPDVKGPSGTLRFEVLFAAKDSTQIRQAVVACRCQGTQEEGKEVGWIPGWTTGGEDEYAWFDDGTGKKTVTNEVIGRFIETIDPKDMNKTVFVCVTPTPGKLFIPAGWELDSVDGKVQDVQLYQNLECETVSSQDALLVSLFPGFGTGHTIRTLCLEIDKPEPRPGTEFRLVPPRLPSLARLARFTRRSRMVGPADQARLWIATDQASYDRVAEVLSPSPGPGTYLREMHRAALALAIQVEDPKIQKIMEPRLLLAEDFNVDAVKWAFGTMIGADAGKTCRWLRGQSSALGDAFGWEKPERAVQLFDTLVGVLADEGTKLAAETAVWLLSEGAPAANRPALAASGGAQRLALSAAGARDEGAATVIRGWLEKTDSPFKVMATPASPPPDPDRVRAATGAGRV